MEDGNVELLRCRGDEKAALGEQPLTLKRAAYVCGGCIDRCKPVKGSHKLVPVLGVAGRVTNFKVADAGRARSPFAASGLTTSRTCSRPSRFTTLVSRRNVSATLRHDPEGAHRPAGPALRLGVPDGLWPGAAPRSWRAMFGRARQIGHAAAPLLATFILYQIREPHEAPDSVPYSPSPTTRPTAELLH